MEWFSKDHYKCPICRVDSIIDFHDAFALKSHILISNSFKMNTISDDEAYNICLNLIEDNNYYLFSSIYYNLSYEYHAKIGFAIIRNNRCSDEFHNVISWSHIISKDSDGNTIFHLLSKTRNNLIFKFIPKSNDKSVLNFRNNVGKTPLDVEGEDCLEDDGGTFRLRLEGRNFKHSSDLDLIESSHPSRNRQYFS